jgi:Domain of unknown function (DUF5979)/Thioester domain
MSRHVDGSGRWVSRISSWRARLTLAMPGRAWRLPVLLVLISAVVLMDVAPAGAVFRGPAPKRPPRLQSNTNTELTLTSTGYGTSVQGFIADPTNPFDPTTGYPESDPVPGSGWTAKDESFAGVIHAQPTGGGSELSLYCIDILTNTYIGYGYMLGTWNEANVPNVGYVARLLSEYYPNTGEPSSLTDLNQRAAAVQAAIWFFSDRYVLSESNSLHSTVAAIVTRIIAEGPLVEPPPPTLTLTPSQVSGPAGSVVGPFTLNTNNTKGLRHRRRRRRPRVASEATVTATGGNMFSDAAGTVAIPNGSTVPSGQKIWVRSTGPSTAVIQATATATVPSGNVYLYSGNSGPSGAQKLILAQTATLTTTVQATAEFLAPGSLKVTKTVAGPAAGSQGAVVISVQCDDGVSRLPFTVSAHAAAGDQSHTYDNIAVGTQCTVLETSNGSTVGVSVVVVGDGQQATIVSGQTETVHITDTYSFIGALLVRKTIAGPAAGQQGPITIHSVCDGTPLTPDFTIPAGASAGDQTMQYNNIPVPSATVPANCTVTETANGATSTVAVVVTGSGQTVPVAPGDIAEADVSDTYGLAPGQLEVTKSITGPLAGQQGQVVIHTVCNGTALTPDFVIPAGATGNRSQMYSGIPTTASCVVTETANGATSTVSATVNGSPQTATIAPGGAEAAHITDTYGPAPGSLLVTKTIAGTHAGQQGPVTIHSVCNGTALSPDFVIAAGTSAGSVSHSYDGIPAGSSCTVTETADGTTNTITATVSGNGQTVTVPAGKVVPVSLANAYELTPVPAPDVPTTTNGFLRVTKTITGPAAGKQGQIAILVACAGAGHDYAYLIPAHHPGGSVTRAFTLPAGTRCTVIETNNGKTGTVTVASTGRHKKVTIPAGRTVNVRITDTFFGVQAVSVTG